VRVHWLRRVSIFAFLHFCISAFLHSCIPSVVSVTPEDFPLEKIVKYDKGNGRLYAIAQT
jgi:hypothetical protein